MANYANAKATIAANIYTNHTGQVTAEMVKTAANEIVNTLIAGGYLYAGVAKLTPTQTNPGSPDANVFYIATEPGTYTNFVGAGGPLVVADGEVAIFKFNGTWSKEVTGAASAASVTELAKETQYLADIHKGYIDKETGVWKDVGTGSRYYAIVPIDGTEGDSLTVRCNAVNQSVFAILSGYNPVTDSDAGVLYRKDFKVRELNTDITVTIPAGAKYLYVFYNAYGDNMLPQRIIIDNIDLLDALTMSVLKLQQALSDSIDGINNSISAINSEINGDSLDGQYEVPSGVQPSSRTFLDYTDISSYGFKSGDTIPIYVDLGGSATKYRIYINGTNKGSFDEGLTEYILDEDADTIRLNIASSSLILDEGLTVGGTVAYSIELIKGLKEEIEDIEKGLVSGDVISRNRDKRDIVYDAKFINNLSDKTQIQLFQLLVSGDIHHYVPQMDSIVEYFNAIQSIDAGIMLGDIVGGNYADDFSFYVPILQKIKDNKPFITIAGNHDMGSSTDPALDAPSMHAYYERYYATTLPFAHLAIGEHSGENCYFFKDFSTYKIRMIMLNEFDYPDDDLTDLVDGQLRYQRGVSMYSQEQINWLISTLNSTPSDYAVIVALHMCPWRMHGMTSPFTAVDFEGNFGRTSSVMSGDVVGDIINAWKNGTILSETYTIEVPSVRTSVTAAADFTARGNGEFVCYIGGHWHNYIISHDEKYRDQLMVSINNAGCVARESDMPRLSGSKSEDAFAIMSIDRVNKCINLVTIGARMNCRMVEREVLRIAYQ